MKNIWKWIIGIVLGLIVVAALVGLVFVAHNTMAANFAPGNMPKMHAWSDLQNGPMPGKFLGERGPSMRGHGFGAFHRGLPFGHGFMIIGGLMKLIPLALLGLLLVIAYRLGKRATVVSPAVVAPVAIVAPIATHTCPKCGESVQDDWKYCPSCGKKQ